MTEQATEGGLREPSENLFAATVVIFIAAAPAGRPAPRWLSPRWPPGAVAPRPAARWLPAPRCALFGSDYRAAVAPAVPASLS